MRSAQFVLDNERRAEEVVTEGENVIQAFRFRKLRSKFNRFPAPNRYVCNFFGCNFLANRHHSSYPQHAIFPLMLLTLACQVVAVVVAAVTRKPNKTTLLGFFFKLSLSNSLQEVT